MKVIKSSKYKRDIKYITNKHLKKELTRIHLIEALIINSNNMKELLLNPLSKTYNIEKKVGNLKEIYTAKINNKIRMFLLPIGTYPYHLEEIIEVELIQIDSKHYKDG